MPDNAPDAPIDMSSLQGQPEFPPQSNPPVEQGAAPSPARQGMLDRSLSAAKAPGHYVGEAFGKALSGLSGTQNQYSIDPNTGQTVATPVKSSPTDTFRSILALGLMGAQGIGPKHGDVTFTQGLLSGLGGGAKEAVAHSQDIDKQRREQAQTDYANQLKAQEEQRQQKKLSMEEQLNQVQIADYWQQISARHMTMDKMTREAAKEGAQPKVDYFNLGVVADKPLNEGFISTGAQAVDGAKNVAFDDPDAQKFIDNHSGSWSTKYVPVQTGVRTEYNPKTLQFDVKPLYTLYEANEKVPENLLSRLETASKTDPTFKTIYADLKRKSEAGADVPSRQILQLHQRLTDWGDIQEKAATINEKNAAAQRDLAEGWKARIDASLSKLSKDEANELKLGSTLVPRYFDLDTLQLTPQAYQDLDPNAKDANGKLIHTTRASQLEAEKNRNAVNDYIFTTYQNELKDAFDKNKITKDAQGNIVSTAGNDSTGLISMLHAYAQASSVLANGLQRKPNSNLSPVAKSIFARISSSNVTDPKEIQEGFTSSGVPENIQREVWQALGLTPPPSPSPLENVPAGYTLVKNDTGTTILPNSGVESFLQKHHDYSKVGQGTKKADKKEQELGTFNGEDGTTLTR